MSFPQNDARRRHDLVQTVETISNEILPFSIDETHVHQVKGREKPTLDVPMMHGDLLPLTPLHNYRVMLELHDPRPGKHASWNLANTFISYLLKHSDDPKNRRETEFLNADGKTVRLLDPINHRFQAGIGKRNGTAEQILRLEREPKELRTPVFQEPKPTSRKAAVQLEKGYVATGFSMKQYFPGIELDVKTASKLGRAFSAIEARGFTQNELFDLAHSLEKRVHRKYSPKDVIDIARSIKYFSDQGYSHENTLRLARVASTIRGPVVVLRGDFQNKGELVNFANKAIESAIEDMNRIARDPNQNSGLQPNIPEPCKFVTLDDINYITSVAASTLGKVADNVGNKLKDVLGPNVPGSKLIWGPPIAAGNALHAIARKQDFSKVLER